MSIDRLPRWKAGAGFRSNRRRIARELHDDVSQRLAAIQTQLQSRLSAYEQRIAELEEEVSAKDQANRELLAAQMQMMKQVLETSPAVEEETQKT